MLSAASRRRRSRSASRWIAVIGGSGAQALSGHYADPGSRPNPPGEAVRGPSSSSIALDPEPTAQADPLQTFITTPTAGLVDCEADIHTGLLHVGAHRSRDGAELLWNTPVEPLICNYLPLCGNRRLSQFVEQRLGFF